MGEKIRKQFKKVVPKGEGRSRNGKSIKRKPCYKNPWGKLEKTARKRNEGGERDTLEGLNPPSRKCLCGFFCWAIPENIRTLPGGSTEIEKGQDRGKGVLKKEKD